MKKKIMIIVLLGWIGGWNTHLTAQPTLPDNAAKSMQIEKTSSSPHCLHLGYGLLMYKEAYRIFTKMPIMHFTLTYTYDIPWRYERTNLFVVTGSGYSGGRREQGLYKSSANLMYERYFYDQVHLFGGVGFNVKLPYSLNLSFSTALDFSSNIEVASYPSYYNKEKDDGVGYMFRVPYVGVGIQCRTALFLTYEIKNVLISAGCHAYFGLEGEAHWKRANQLSRTWATLGVGYRF